MTEKTWVFIRVAAAPWAPAPHAAVPSFFSLWTEGQQTPHSCGSGTLTHSNKAHGVTRGQLHHRNTILSSKKILLNSRICACTTSTEECAGVFLLSSIPGRLRGGVTWNLRWAEWRNDENLYSLATGLFERGASERQKESRQMAASIYDAKTSLAAETLDFLIKSYRKCSQKKS